MRIATTVMMMMMGLGCLGWEEAPEGATGFLVVDDVELVGTVDGAIIEAGTGEVVAGYCTEFGWHVELRAQAGDQEVLNILDVEDLAMADRDLAVRFVALSGASDELSVEELREPGRMKIQTCLGSGADEVEEFARDVDLVVTSAADGDVRVDYVANFASGDRVHGQFTMEMPVVD